MQYPNGSEEASAGHRASLTSEDLIRAAKNEISKVDSPAATASGAPATDVAGSKNATPRDGSSNAGRSGGPSLGISHEGGSSGQDRPTIDAVAKQPVGPAAPPPPPPHPAQMAAPEAWWQAMWRNRWARTILPLGIIAAGAIWQTSGSLANLEPGDCFDIPPVEVIEEVDPVDCAEQHEVEVVAEIHLAEADSATYPGQDELIGQAIEDCFDDFLLYTGVSMFKTDLGVYTLVPAKASWDDGDRSALCLVAQYSDTGEIVAVTGSLKTDSPVPAPVSFETADMARVRDVTFSNARIENLEIGDCIADLDITTGSNRVVDCHQPHGGEVYALVDLSAASEDGEYPGLAGVLSETLCLQEFEAYTGTEFERSRLWVTNFYPTYSGWQSGDHIAECLLVAVDANSGDLVAVIGPSRSSGR